MLRNVIIMIPKIIHYCWLSNDAMPNKLARCVDSWKKYCPDYEIINWNFDRLGKNCPLWVRQAYDVKKYAFAADWVRAYTLYNYGGIYLDSDVEIIKPLDDLLVNTYCLSFEANSSETIEAAVMMSVAGYPFFKDLLAYYDDRSFIQSDGNYDMLPLPHIINKICKGKYDFNSIVSPKEYINDSMDTNRLSILPADYFSPKSLTTGKIMLTSNTYAIHHFAASWQTPNKRFKKWLKYNMPPILRFLIICKHLINGTRPI